MAVVLLSLGTSVDGLATGDPRWNPASTHSGAPTGPGSAPHSTESFESIARHRPRDRASTAAFMLRPEDRARAVQLAASHEPLGLAGALAEQRLYCSLGERPATRVTGLVLQGPPTTVLTGGFNNVVDRKQLLGHRMRLSPGQNGDLLLEVVKLTGRRVFAGSLVLHPTLVGGHTRELVGFRGTEQNMTRARQRPWNGFYPCFDVESDRATLEVSLQRPPAAAKKGAAAEPSLWLMVNTKVEWIHGDTPEGSNPYQTTRIPDRHLLTLLGAQIADRL